jgi:hypothetical protein
VARLEVSLSAGGRRQSDEATGEQESAVRSTQAADDAREIADRRALADLRLGGIISSGPAPAQSDDVRAARDRRATMRLTLRLCNAIAKRPYSDMTRSIR